MRCEDSLIHESNAQLGDADRRIPHNFDGIAKLLLYSTNLSTELLKRL